jgi:hypothetical protein
MRKIKVIYSDGEIKYIETDEVDKEIIYQCDYENLSCSIGAHYNDLDAREIRHVKALIIGEKVFLFKYNEKQGFYMHI